MNQAGPELSIVIPVFNEAENILAVLLDLRGVQTPHEVLIVYDSEEDTTLPVVRSGAEQLDNVRLVRNVREGGVLNAMRTGMQAAKAPLIAIMMADRADDARDIDRMVACASRGADLVAASRYVSGGHQIGGPRV